MVGLRDGQSGGLHLSASWPPRKFLDLLRASRGKGQSRYVKFFESLGNCVNSLQTCFFYSSPTAWSRRS